MSLYRDNIDLERIDEDEIQDRQEALANDIIRLRQEIEAAYKGHGPPLINRRVERLLYPDEPMAPIITIDVAPSAFSLDYQATIPQRNARVIIEDNVVTQGQIEDPVIWILVMLLSVDTFHSILLENEEQDMNRHYYRRFYFTFPFFLNMVIVSRYPAYGFYIYDNRDETTPLQALPNRIVLRHANEIAQSAAPGDYEYLEEVAREDYERKARRHGYLRTQRYQPHTNAV